MYNGTMRKRVIVALALMVLLVMVVGALSLKYIYDPVSKDVTSTIQSNNIHTEEENKVSEDHVVQVVYTETGFSPSRIEIEIGTTVKFTNVTSGPLWVGSDPHPVHSDHPEFDAKKDYLKDETYSYTFNQVGTYGFHNHKKSLYRGVVVVTDENAHIHDIDKTPDALKPVRDSLISMLDPYDPDTIFDVIDSIQSDSNLSLNCHDVAHDIGHRAYELYGFSEAMTFNNPNHVDHPLVQYICAGGYMHGILEALSMTQPEFILNPDLICETMSEIEKDSCFHGVGHLFMLANERDVDEALLGCRLVGDDPDMYRCFEGVRMEQFWGNTDHVSTTTLGWDTSDPAATCISSQKDEKPTCFLYAPFGYLREHPKDYFGAVQFCMDPRLTRSDSSFCLKGLGITMMSKFNGRDLEGSELYVTGLDADLKYAFYQGVLGYAQLSGKSASELSMTCGKFSNDSPLCFSVYQSMEPTFAAYEELNSRRDALRNSQSLHTAREYFDFANQRNLVSIESLLKDETTFSTAEGVYLGSSQIMDSLRVFFGEYTTLFWDVEAYEEVQPGITKVTFIFYGTTHHGTSVEKNGVAYIIAQDNKLKHIEIR
jgi:plastocyanin